MMSPARAPPAPEPVGHHCLSACMRRLATHLAERCAALARAGER